MAPLTFYQPSSVSSKRRSAHMPTRRPLRWNASAHEWIGCVDDGTRIFVSEQIYEQCLKAFLARQEISWNTWMGYMRSAERAWEMQCTLAERLRANLGYWMTCTASGIRVWPPREDQDSRRREGYALRWSASGRCWFGRTDEGTTVLVPEDIYEHNLSAFLASHGITFKVWTQYMRPAEVAWQRQCEATNRLQADLEYWITRNEPGIWVIPSSQRQSIVQQKASDQLSRYVQQHNG